MSKGLWLFSLLAVLAVVAPQRAWADAAEDADVNATAAIQDRTYHLNWEVDITGGVLPGDVYTKSITAGGGLVYHFTDHLAWAVAHGGYCFSLNTGLKDQLIRDFTATDNDFEQPTFFAGTALMFKPFYGKSSVVNKYAVHFDTQIVLGANLYKYTIGGFAPAVSFGAGVRIFQNHVMSWRLDFTDDVVIFFKKAPINVPAITLTLALNFGSNE